MTGTTLRARAAAFTAASAIALAGAATAAEVDTVNRGVNLTTFDSASPGTVLRSRAITGLRPGDTIAAIDYRPASPRLLYGLGSSGQLYLINRMTGQAFAVGAPVTLVGGGAASVGFDFNPSVDRIRVTTSFGQNLRLNPDTGAVAGVDGPLVYAATDRNAGVPPAVVGAAYTNNVAGGTPTTLYVIDATRAVLATQGSVNSTPVSPNTGTLFTVGSLGVRSNTAVGFDISGTGEALATFTDPNTFVTSLYRINLATGAATLIGTLGGNALYQGLAIALAPFASLGSTPNQQAVGGVLDLFSAVPSAATLAVFNGLDAMGSGTAQGLGQLTPQSFTVLPDLSFRVLHSQADVIDEHLRHVRAGSSLSAGGMAVGDMQGFGMFLTLKGRDGLIDAAPDRPKVTYDGGGAMVGFDLRPAPNLLLGVATGYDEGSARLGFGSGADIDTTWIAGYGSTSYRGFFADGFVSGARAKHDLRRVVALPGAGFITSSQADADVFGAGLTIGTQLTYGALMIEPFAGVRYARWEMDGFAERGGDVANLTVGDQDEESTQSRLGARAAFDTVIAGMALRPEFRAAWVHEFEADEGRTIRARLGDAALSGFSFVTNPVDDEDVAEVGARLTFAGDYNMSLMLDVSGRKGGDVEEAAFSLGLRVPF